ncbi:hypothetical protein AXG93_4225s1350 [Marchantia polymorpha subsp. ruderalis]|uniref:F-box domain-containing protein n=1 Tax=Marchantia polymorpha subsp. ruderalis TaxID=1480154 RepID=A0A176WTA6_MARPO|nr:hypothetical protein AXG93_4225s1350 [Marchantia polymorpha subsp. ruderalis]
MDGVMKPMSTCAPSEVKFDPGACDLQLGDTGFEDLPESCIAHVLCFLSTKDIAISACTNRAFRGASLSDAVWQAKLPKDYTEVLAKAKDGARAFDSKKQIFDYLCSTILLHGHEVEFLSQSNEFVEVKALKPWTWVLMENNGIGFSEVVPDLIAPGVHIVAACNEAQGTPNHTKYKFDSGTSMACPHAPIDFKTKSTTWIPAAIKSALMTTGEIDIENAVAPGVVLDLREEDYAVFLCNASHSNDQSIAVIVRPGSCPWNC